MHLDVTSARETAISDESISYEVFIAVRCVPSTVVSVNDRQSLFCTAKIPRTSAYPRASGAPPIPEPDNRSRSSGPSYSTAICIACVELCGSTSDRRCPSRLLRAHLDLRSNRSLRLAGSCMTMCRRTESKMVNAGGRVVPFESQPPCRYSSEY